MTKLTTNAPSALARVGDLERAIEAAADISIDLFMESQTSCPQRAFSLDALEQAILRAEAAIANGEVERATTALDESLQLATGEQIKLALAEMICSFPQIATRDARVYSKSMVEDVADARPTALALAIACRLIRTNWTFPPAIAEVLKIVRTVEARIRSAPAHVAQLPQRLAEAKTVLARERKLSEFYRRRDQNRNATP